MEMENGSWKSKNRKCKLKMEVGKWKLESENGNWKLENGNCKLENGNGKRQVAWHLLATVTTLNLQESF